MRPAIRRMKDDQAEISSDQLSPDQPSPSRPTRYIQLTVSRNHCLLPVYRNDAD
jgi:hypothetical protein